MMIEVRSYAVALWLYSKGHVPVDSGYTPDGTFVFSFSPSAAVDIGTYHEAKAILMGLEARARALRNARQRVGGAV
jgi:hypothetical protein